MLTCGAAIKENLKTAVEKSMTLAKDAGTALDGNDPNVNELKGWFFADYRIDTVKGKISGIGRTQRLKLTIFSSQVSTRMCKTSRITKRLT